MRAYHPFAYLRLLTYCWRSLFRSSPTRPFWDTQPKASYVRLAFTNICFASFDLSTDLARIFTRQSPLAYHSSRATLEASLQYVKALHQAQGPGKPINRKSFPPPARWLRRLYLLFIFEVQKVVYINFPEGNSSELKRSTKNQIAVASVTKDWDF